MQLNKKKIISQSKLFIFIITFIILFKSVFGEENTLIGVTTITAMLMFLAVDLTLNPIENTIKLVLFNVSLGLAAFFAMSNMYLGIVINFISVFIVVFTLCHDLKMASYLPFMLQYMFMLAIPVSYEQLPKRLFSLVVGAIIIILYQIIINRDKFSKQGNNILVQICNSIIEKINLKKKNEDYSNIENKIDSLILQFKKIVYDKRHQNYYLTEESTLKLSIVMSLGRINYFIDELSKEKFNTFIDDVVALLDNIKLSFEVEEKIANIDHLFIELFEKYKECRSDEIILFKILDASEFIKESLYKLRSLEKKHYNFTLSKESIPDKYKTFSIYRRNFTKDSLRFSFAFRYALGITIGCFIASFFNLEEGRWIIFTIGALSQPQYELSKKRSKDRIFGTIFGVIIVTVLFSIFKNETIRLIFIMLSGYVSGYLIQYKYKTITNTFSAIGSAAMLGGVHILSITRIFFVIFGVVIALLLSEFVFPFKTKDANRELFKNFQHTIFELLKQIDKLLKGDSSEDEFKNLLIISSLIDDKLKTNNSITQDILLDEYLNNQEILIMNIYDLYYWIKRKGIDKSDTKDLIRDIKTILNNEDDVFKCDTDEIINQLNIIDNYNVKIPISNLVEIIKGLKTTERIKVY